MESLVSYASLLVEKSNMTTDQVTEQRKIDSRKKIDPLRNAHEICARFIARGHVFPCRWVDRQNDPLKEQEFKDALKLTRWKLALKGNRTGYGICCDEVREYLDVEMRGWRDDIMKRSASLKHAQDIARRYVIRGNTLPHPLWDNTSTDSIRIQEHKDYLKLLVWYKSLHGTGRKCPAYIFQYLDKEIPEWSEVAEFPKKTTNSMNKNLHKKMKVPKELSIEELNSNNPIQILQTEVFNCGQASTYGNTHADIDESNYSDGSVSRKRQLDDMSTHSSSSSGTPSCVLSSTMSEDNDFNEQTLPFVIKRTKTPTFSDKDKTKRLKIDPLTYAQDIVHRYHERGNVFPCRWVDRQNDPLKEQEFKDALKLTRWKLALKGNRTGYGVCCDEVREYLDSELLGWRLDRSA